MLQFSKVKLSDCFHVDSCFFFLHRCKECIDPLFLGYVMCTLESLLRPNQLARVQTNASAPSREPKFDLSFHSVSLCRRLFR